MRAKLLCTSRRTVICFSRLPNNRISACLPTTTACSTVAFRPLRPFHVSSRICNDRVSLVETRISQPATTETNDQRLSKLKCLPKYCPGCGAPSQIVADTEAGYYPLDRHRISDYVKRASRTASIEDGNTTDSPSTSLPPTCERCHNMVHHNVGSPILHPSIGSIQAIIEESPLQHNHIYHVVDAADFPMSLIPNLQHELRLPKLRSHNRRAKTVTYSRGRVAEVSFIITRADLLAPKKEQVDSMMPYLREVLRQALSIADKNARLGNMKCVSAKRGWWTRELKEDIWKRGGAGWMVGKVNVGKSNLYHAVFPKGRYTHDRLEAPRPVAGKADEIPDAPSEGMTEVLDDAATPADDLNESLLPPARTETAYPDMPIVSSLPGTTASPIRIPFGNGKGELIDLPGVARSSFEEYVLPAERDNLVMKSRVTPEQMVIKPGQTLVLGGGLLYITSTTPDLVILAYPCIPVSSHVTSTQKAEAMRGGEREIGIPSIIVPDAHQTITSAAHFELAWDVTKQRAGPLTDPKAVKLHTDRLPFTIWSTDIIIEGVGWIELVAQVRKRRDADADADGQVSRPAVQVFSPKGQHVASRPPMGAWLLGGKKTVPKRQMKSRPRRSMRSVRLGEKAEQARKSMAI